MKILMVHQIPCIRMRKEALALKSEYSSIEVYLVHHYTKCDTSGFDGVYVYEDIVTLNEVIRSVDPDIIHCHNEPNETVLMVMALPYDTPIIHDTHDLISLRSPHSCEPADFLHEALSNKYVSGCVYPTDRLREFATAQYCVKHALTLESRHLRVDICDGVPDLDTDSRLRIVWQGGLRQTLEKFTAYRYMKPVFVALEKWFDIEVYPAKMFMDTGDITAKEFYENYVDLDFTTINEPLPYKDLLAKCGDSHYGLVGFNADCVDQDELTYIQLAMPNKLFDYIAAGIPVITLNCDLVARFVREFEIGLVIDREFGPWIEEEAREHYKRFKRNVEAIQEKTCMEREIFKLRDLYRRVLRG